jgi:hypothetical protein
MGVLLLIDLTFCLIFRFLVGGPLVISSFQRVVVLIAVSCFPSLVSSIY